MRRLISSLAASMLISSMTVTQAAEKLTFELPKQLAWTAYDTGSAGYNQSIAIGAALQNEADINLRILPGKNDVSRFQPLRQGKVQFSATGLSGTYLAQEGVFEFGAPAWGPQPLRLVLSNNASTFNIALGAAADVGIKTMNDLKGKRVAWVNGSPAINLPISAFLSYANLSWDDVEKVEFGGYSDAWQALIAGKVDAMLASTNSGLAYQAAAGPRGLYWIPLDLENKDGLARLIDMVPYLSPNTATEGANLSETETSDGVTYAYPVLSTMDAVDENLVYNMTKAMLELFPVYDGKSPGIQGWAMEKQNRQTVVPFHAGSIRYFKEIGQWSDENQAYNDKLVTRQAAMKKAWDALLAEKPADWEAAWKIAREKALADAGFKVVAF